MGQSNCQQYRNLHMVITSPYCITDCFNCLSIIGIFTLSVDVDKQIFLILGKMCDFSDENSISSAKVGIICKQISCEYKLTWYSIGKLLSLRAKVAEMLKHENLKIFFIIYIMKNNLLLWYSYILQWKMALQEGIASLEGKSKW